MTWTREEEMVLVELSADGVDAVVAGIRERLGRRRSAAAVQKKASRMGLSLKRRALCPECRSWCSELTKDGMCRACSYELLAAEFRKKAEAAGREVVLNARREEEAKRLYDKERQRYYRAKRKAERV